MLRSRKSTESIFIIKFTGKSVNIQSAGSRILGYAKIISVCGEKNIAFRVDCGRTSQHRSRSTHLPDANTIGKKSWLAAYWAILDDIVEDQSPTAAGSLTKGSSALSVSSSLLIDEKRAVLNHIGSFCRDSFREIDKEGRSVLHMAARLDSVPLFGVSDAEAAEEELVAGSFIVFDDSFEHEVSGSRDRFVVLILLKHSDIQTYADSP
jgi:hypothetical protein